MKTLAIWVVKRIHRDSWGQSVSVNGVRYVPEEYAERLFQERKNLVRKLFKTRNKLRDLRSQHQPFIQVKVPEKE